MPAGSVKTHSSGEALEAGVVLEQHMGNEGIITSDNLRNRARFRAAARLGQPELQEMCVVRLLTETIPAVSLLLKKSSKNPSPAFSPVVLRVLACDLLSDTDGRRPGHAEPSSTAKDHSASCSNYCRESNYLGTLVFLCFPGYSQQLPKENRHWHVLWGQQPCTSRILSTESRWRGTSSADTGPKHQCFGVPDKGFSCFSFLCFITVVTSGLGGAFKVKVILACSYLLK